MKTKLVLLASVLFSLVFKAQDSLFNFELGVPLATYNFFDNAYYANDQPAVEYINGIFFRVTTKRLGLRAEVDYKTLHPADDHLVINVDRTPAISTNYKDMRAGAGLQFSITRKKDWVYIFADAAYRKMASSGFYDGGAKNDVYSFSSNGLFSRVGFGLKTKLFRVFYVSGEFGYNLIAASIKNTRTNIPTGLSNIYSYSDQSANPFGRLILTVKF